jgi:hypothetical protein
VPSSAIKKSGTVGESMTSYTVDVGLGGTGAGSGFASPKSNPRGSGLDTTWFGGFAEEKRIEEVEEVCDDGGR